jgi:tetratricopeptide (TPR) repeat protein
MPLVRAAFLSQLVTLSCIVAGIGFSPSMAFTQEAENDAGRQRAQELIAQAVNLYPKLSSTSGAGPNLFEAEAQGQAREKIESLYEEAVKAAPTFPAVYIARGQYYKRVNKQFNAQDDFESATTLPDAPIEAWAELSAIADQFRDRALAKKIANDAFTQAAGKDGPQGVATLVVGQLALRAERWNEAIEMANHALSIPSNAESMEWMRIRGLSQLALGNDAAAVTDLNNSQTSSSMQLVYKAKAPNMTAVRVLEHARDFQKENGSKFLDLDLLDCAIALDPNLGEAYLERAKAFWEIRKNLLEYRGKMRRHKDAVQDYRLAKIFTAEAINGDSPMPASPIWRIFQRIPRQRRNNCLRSPASRDGWLCSVRNRLHCTIWP